MAATVELVQERIQSETVTAAWDADLVFRQHWPRLRRLLFQLLGNRAEAEDMAMEAFVRLFTRPPRTLENPGGWLYRVAWRQSRNAIRGRNREKRRVENLEDAGAGSRELDPLTRMGQEQEKELVRQTLQGLRPRESQLLLLRHSGASYGEIARLLKVAPGSVGTLLARAQRQFEKSYRIRQGGRDASR